MCSTPYEDDLYREASAIFTAEFIDGGGSADCGSKKVTARVDRVYKGQPSKEVYILSADACVSSGVYTKKGEKYLIYGRAAGNDSYRVEACGGTRPLIAGNKRADDDLAVLEERRQQIEALGEAIAKNPQQERLLLRTMAEHEIYWQDYASAENTLRRLIELNARDAWVLTQFIITLHKLHKAQEVWDFYDGAKQVIGSRRQPEVVAAVSFATIELNKTPDEWFYYRFKDMKIEDKSFIGLKFDIVSFDESYIRKVNFSDTKFERLLWTGASANIVDFSRAFFRRFDSKNSRIDGVNFTATQLEKMTAVDTRFQYSDFTAAKLNGAQISKTDFYHAKLVGTELRNAIINETSFKKADISGADFTGASFEGVDWTDVIYDCKTKGVPLPPKTCPSAP